LKLWQNKASIGDIADFECLQNFFQTVNCETEDTNLESKIKPFVHKHFDVLLQNFQVSLFSKRRLIESDFSVMDCAALYRREIRIELLEIIELRSDLIRKAEFKTFINYPNLWVSLLSIPDYRNLSQKAISVLVRMPTTYTFVNKDFLLLSKLNQKRETQPRTLI